MRLKRGVVISMSEIIKVFLSISVTGGISAFALIALKALYKNRLKKSWQYYIWLIALFRMLLPLTPEASLIGLVSRAGASAAMPEKISISGEFSLFGRIIWLAFPLTAIILLAAKIAGYLSYLKFIASGRSELTCETAIRTYNAICADMGIKRRIPAYAGSNVNAPMLVGLFRPYIILPETDYSEEIYGMIFRHELTHYKRGDILYKWLVQITACVHWFNPAVYLMRGEINKNCELSCDEAVLSSLGERGRLSYGDALIALVQKGGAQKSGPVTVMMSEEGENVKERLTSIMKYSKKSIAIKIISAVSAIALSGGAFFLGAYPTADPVSAPYIETQAVQAEPVSEKTYVQIRRLASDGHSWHEMKHVENDSYWIRRINL
jgi:beta-lactamase regulating signal transducer with metallopeptidase domain